VSLKGIWVNDAANLMGPLISPKGIRFSHHQMSLVSPCFISYLQTQCYNRPAQHQIKSVLSAPGRI
jgi:hypothetical protein